MDARADAALTAGTLMICPAVATPVGEVADVLTRDEISAVPVLGDAGVPPRPGQRV